MSDCQINDPVNIASVSVPSQSSILNYVTSLVPTYSNNTYSLEPPNFGNFNLSAYVSSVSTSLQAPSSQPISPPVLRPVSVEALQQVTYSALNSAVAFSYSSPLVPPVNYANGLSHLAVPDVNVPAPPTDYPVEALLPLPDDPTLPVLDKPDIRLGTKPVLDSLTPITFAPTPIAPLDMPAGVLDGVDSLRDALPELPYRPPLEYTADAAAIAKLRDLMRGNDEVAQWLTQQVLLFAADARRLPVETKQAIDKVFEQAAARNFALPTGIVDAQVAQIAAAELEQKHQLIEKIEAEVVDAALAAVLTSIQAAASVERYHAALYAQYIQQNIALYKLNVASATAVFNALLQMYEAYGQIVQQHVENYNRYVAAVAEQNRARLADVDLLTAQVTSYMAQVTMYRADAETLMSKARVEDVSARVQTLPLQVYAAKLQGLLANFSIFETNVKAYRQAVQNYAKSFQLVDARVAAFESAVRAEASRAEVSEANVRAYAQMLSAERQRVSSYEDYIRSSTSALEARLADFRAAMDAERSYLSAAGDVMQANLQTLASYAEVAQAQYATVNDYNLAKTSYTRSMNRAQIISEDLRITQQLIGAAANVQRDRLKLAEKEITIRSNGALAQAASTIYNVGVSAVGTANHDVRGSFSAAKDRSYSTRASWSKACREEVRALRG